MTLSNLPLVTPLSRGNGVDDAKSNNHSRISELRVEFADLAQSVSDIAALRVAQAEQLAVEGTATLRSNIEARPFAAVGIAAAAGALLAVAVVPRKSRGFRYNDSASYNANDIEATVRRAISRGVDTQPITTRLERLVDSISSIDPSALTSSPAYDTAKTWLQAAVNSLRKN
jgi:ElaB/YqjD/DUF883 family membrane-anchored ribosome-binding protein